MEPTSFSPTSAGRQRFCPLPWWRHEPRRRHQVTPGILGGSRDRWGRILRASRSWYAAAGVLLGALGPAAAAVSPTYRQSLAAATYGDDRLYANLVMGSLISGLTLIPLRARKRLAALAHVAIGLALIVYLLRPLVTHADPGLAWRADLLITGALLLTGGFIYLKPRRMCRRSFLPLRNFHLTLAVTYVAKYFGEAFAGSIRI